MDSLISIAKVDENNVMVKLVTGDHKVPLDQLADFLKENNNEIALEIFKNHNKKSLQ